MGQQAVSTIPYLGKQSQRKRMLARETEDELKETLDLMGTGSAVTQQPPWQRLILELSICYLICGV